MRDEILLKGPVRKQFDALLPTFDLKTETKRRKTELSNAGLSL